MVMVGTTVLGASVLLGADSSGSGSGDGKDLKGEAKGEGSSTVAPIVEKLNENGLKIIQTLLFHLVKQVLVLVLKNSSAKLISHKLLDLLKMKKTKLEDKDIKYKEFKIAQDGVTVAVNKDNDFVKELSKDQKKSTTAKLKLGKDVNSSWPDKNQSSLQTQVTVLMISLKKK